MIITPVKFKPPTGTAFLTIHWTVAPREPAAIEAHLKKLNLHPVEIFKDAGGCLWIPLEKESETK